MSIRLFPCGQVTYGHSNPRFTNSSTSPLFTSHSFTNPRFINPVQSSPLGQRIPVSEAFPS